MRLDTEQLCVYDQQGQAHKRLFDLPNPDLQSYSNRFTFSEMSMQFASLSLDSDLVKSA